MDVTERWRPFAAIAAERFDRPALLFHAAHLAMALAAGGDWATADRHLGVLRERAGRDRTRLTGEVLVPLVESLHAFVAGEYRQAIERVEPLRGRIIELGGSRAQRDVFHDTLYEACFRAGDTDRAERYLAERIARRPDHYWKTRAVAGARLTRAVSARPWLRPALLVLLLAAALLAACASLGTRDADLVRITLLQVNDLYVLGPVDGGQRGGIARLATLVHEARRENPHTVFVLAGDTLSPSIESRVLRGAQMVAALNAIGLDLATFGNHEFDFGPDVLRERMAESKFAWLSANVVDRPSGRVFGGARPDLLLTFDGLAVGFLGLTTPETAWVSSPGPDVVFVDPRVTGREAALRLRARGAKLVVAITHQGMAADRALAGAAGLDVILGGHEHEPLIAEEGKTLITKAGSDARYLVQVDLWVARDGRLVERSWTFREVSQRVPPDPVVRSEEHTSELQSPYDL